MPDEILLDGDSLSIDDVYRVALERARVALSPGARQRVLRTRAIVDDVIRRNAVVYGITTGFGKLSEVAIPKDRLAELQANLVRSHAAGVGPVLPEHEVRAMMLLRANVIAKGYSGARPELVDLPLDVLAIALTNVATISERRTDRLVHPDLNQGLPPFLARDAGVNSGFMIAQIAAASLASECKVLAHPASVDTIPTDGNKEDVVPMAMGAAWKLRRVIRNVQYIVGIELMCAAQAVDYRAPLRPGRGVAIAHERVRN